jgi:hypothetical protein
MTTDTTSPLPIPNDSTAFRAALSDVLLSLPLEKMLELTATFPSELKDTVRLCWYSKNDPAFFATLSDTVWNSLPHNR